ncbi:MAG: prepilin-type N-terminal cleavage/methylation domain-containing protein, partial [Egibacteraceae bacterium]
MVEVRVAYHLHVIVIFVIVALGGVTVFLAIRDRLEQDEKGFTLIELLVVVIIIGILAAIAIPTFLSQRERGWQAELTSGLRTA